MTSAPRCARAALWTTLVVLLAGAGVYAGEEAQDKPNPAPSASPSPTSPVTVEEGNPAGAVTGRGGTGHLLWEGEGGSVALLNRGQFRWTDEMPDDRLQLPGTTSPGSSKGSFRIRRAKTELTGWVWRRELTYELQLSWAGPEPGASTTTPLEDFILNWDASRDKRFQIALGQF
jgi:hypothetical protein